MNAALAHFILQFKFKFTLAAGGSKSFNHKSKHSIISCFALFTSTFIPLYCYNNFTSLHSITSIQMNWTKVNEWTQQRKNWLLSEGMVSFNEWRMGYSCRYVLPFLHLIYFSLFVPSFSICFRNEWNEWRGKKQIERMMERHQQQTTSFHNLIDSFAELTPQRTII